MKSKKQEWCEGFKKVFVDEIVETLRYGIKLIITAVKWFVYISIFTLVMGVILFVIIQSIFFLSWIITQMGNIAWKG